MHFAGFIAIASAIAIAAAQIDIRQELHLDVLETAAGATRTATGSRIEAKRASRISALTGLCESREALADDIESANVTRRVGAGGPADRCLVYEHDVSKLLCTVHAGMRTRTFARSAKMFEQCRMKNILNQRGFSRARNACYANELIEGKTQVDVFEVVFSHTA